MRNCEMSLAHDNSRTVGRKKHWSEDMQARFKAGTFARIKKVIYDHEDRTDFVRAAVERELRRGGTFRQWLGWG